ncbi:MAG: hypothetical protein ACOCUH_00225 [Bacteriovoracia bacterium]
MEKDKTYDLIRNFRDFLHAISNQLTIAQGMASSVKRGWNKPNRDDEALKLKLEKSTVAMEKLIDLVREKRTELIELQKNLYED